MENRSELEKYLIDALNFIKVDNEKKANGKILNDKLKDKVKEYILTGTVQKYINRANQEVPEMSNSHLYLITNGVFELTKDANLNPERYFQEREIKEIVSTTEKTVSKMMKFPYTFKNMIKVEEDDFIGTIWASEIKKLYDNQMIQYNTDTQREARERKDETGEVIKTPKIYEQNVKEIVELIKEDELASTLITFNARFGTSDSDSGEIVYDEDDHALTVTEGTLLDCVDGFHRINAVVRALKDNPDKDMKLKVNIINFPLDKTREHFRQINTISQVSKGQLQEMNTTKFSSNIVQQLRYNSVFRQKISASPRIAPNEDKLVTSQVLIDAIDSIFKPKSRPEAFQTTNYLVEFFDHLFMNYHEEFELKIAENRELSIINTNSMFYGYMVLAKRFKDENISPVKLPNVLNQINFLRDNHLWREKGILDNEQRITNNAKKQIIKFFKELNLDNVKGGVTA